MKATDLFVTSTKVQTIIIQTYENAAHSTHIEFKKKRNNRLTFQFMKDIHAKTQANLCFLDARLKIYTYPYGQLFKQGRNSLLFSFFPQ
ncbi:hypothetical protein [Reinekea sp. G2M2-21]|uniref:hypothetical protein n=1 Tax=Reinekea sp. G2M2-21 TaxID=2788942 RepID=UPI0018AB48A2|nr:hypothetical protein [Reinekea sp. G2M2-21]